MNSMSWESTMTTTSTPMLLLNETLMYHSHTLSSRSCNWMSLPAQSFMSHVNKKWIKYFMSSLSNHQSKCSGYVTTSLVIANTVQRGGTVWINASFAGNSNGVTVHVHLASAMYKKWVCLEYFWKPRVAKSLLFNVTVSLTCTMEFNACRDKSIRSFSVCIDERVRVWVGL